MNGILERTRQQPATAATGEVAALDQLASAALGRVTRQLTHELRNALTGVRCYLELLGGVDLPEMLSSSRLEVEASIDRITDISTGWCDLASGRTATASVNGALHRLVNLYRATGYTRNTQIEESYDERVGRVAMSPALLQSALFALLADLVDGGADSVHVSTVARAGRIEVRLQAFPATVPASGRLPIDPSLLSRALGASVEAFRVPGRGYSLDLEGADEREAEAGR